MSTKRDDSESLLLELTALPTAAGKEHRVQEFLDRWLARRSRSLKWRRDRTGNLLIRRKAPGRTPPLLITAHLDHPAFVVRASEGRDLELEFRGGVHDAYFVDSRIEVFTSDGGRRLGRITELDAAAKPFKLVRARLTGGSGVVGAGDVGRWLFPPASISRDRLRTNACDDLAAVAAALEAFDSIRTRRGCEHVGLLFTVAEEVGFLGAIEVARNATRGRGGLVPRSSRLVCLENSRSFAESPIGGGPIVRVGDRMSVFSPELTNSISRICQEESDRDPEFRWQRRLMPGGACEATAFSSFGFESTCLCLPLGNYHNMQRVDEVLAGKAPARVGREEISMSDYRGLVRMLELVARRLDHESGSTRSRLERLHEERRFVMEG